MADITRQPPRGEALLWCRALEPQRFGSAVLYPTEPNISRNGMLLQQRLQYLTPRHRRLCALTLIIRPVP